MKRAWLAAPILMAFPCAAWAQQELASPGPLLPPALSATEVVQERVGHMQVSIEILGRVSFPGGGTVSDAGISYVDLWDIGLGVSAVGNLMTAINPGFEVGGYVSVGYDWYNGSSATDDFGNKIDPDDLQVTTFFLGGKVRGHYGPGFYWEGHLGLGGVHYAPVDAVFTDFGFPPVRAQLFRSTTHGAFEVGGRFGWGSPHFGMEAGLGYRIMGAPQRGKNISDLVDTDLFDAFDMELGIIVKF